MNEILCTEYLTARRQQTAALCAAKTAIALDNMNGKKKILYPIRFFGKPVDSLLLYSKNLMHIPDRQAGLVLEPARNTKTSVLRYYAVL